MSSNHFEESEIPWRDSEDDIFGHSTQGPGPYYDGASLTTIAMVVVGVIFAIGILFAMAIFIDCRHQKLEALSKNTRRKRKVKMAIPAFVRNANLNVNNTDCDIESFADKMDDAGRSEPAPAELASSSSVIVQVHAYSSTAGPSTSENFTV